MPEALCWCRGGGSIAETPADKGSSHKKSLLNKSSVESVRAFSNGTTASVSQGTVAAPKTVQWTITSPLVDFNRSKRKAGDTDADESLSSIPHFWAVLYAEDGMEGNMKSVLAEGEDKGVHFTKEYQKLKDGAAVKFDIPLFTNPSAIQMGQVLRIDGRSLL